MGYGSTPFKKLQLTLTLFLLTSIVRASHCEGFVPFPLYHHFVVTGVLYIGRAEMACELYILLPPLDCTCVLLTDALKKRTNGNKPKVLSGYDNG